MASLAHSAIQTSIESSPHSEINPRRGSPARKSANTFPGSTRKNSCVAQLTPARIKGVSSSVNHGASSRWRCHGNLLRVSNGFPYLHRTDCGGSSRLPISRNKFSVEKKGARISGLPIRNTSPFRLRNREEYRWFSEPLPRRTRH